MATLGDFPVAAVLRADNLERAADFYSTTLGLKREDQAGPAREAVFSAGKGSTIMIYERPGMPAPENTTLGFGITPEVFEDVVGALRDRGVVFEEYDLPEIGLKTDHGVATFEGDRKSVV